MSSGKFGSLKFPVKRFLVKLSMNLQIVLWEPSTVNGFKTLFTWFFIFSKMISTCVLFWFVTITRCYICQIVDQTIGLETKKVF